jgi:SAM-dependent methyltransferase
MRFELKPERVADFEDQIGQFGDWYHSYSFGDSIYTGFYKGDGLSWGTTWCNSRSAPETVAALRAAYEARDLGPWRDTVFGALKRLPIDPAQTTILDLSSASGRNSFFFCDYGFRRVIASEIREGSHLQHKLILDSIADESYARRTVAMNDAKSADAADFADRYAGEDIDVVCSFGLLYHLTNPMQHLINLKRIARRYVMLYTKTHFEWSAGLQGRRGWRPTIEPSTDIANAAFGFGWIPHQMEVAKAAEQAGLRLIAIDYPEPFARHFPYFNATPRRVLARRAMESIATRVLRRPVGYTRNLDPAYGARFHLNPNYFMYVFEKTDRDVRYG